MDRIESQTDYIILAIVNSRIIYHHHHHFITDRQ
jgi:hypothetical protein